MQCVYNAADLIDAHLVLHRLQDAGITAQVLGQYLTGGIGELPLGGYLRVVVDDQDFDAAMAALNTEHEMPTEASTDSDLNLMDPLPG